MQKLAEVHGVPTTLRATRYLSLRLQSRPESRGLRAEVDGVPQVPLEVVQVSASIVGDDLIADAPGVLARRGINAGQARQVGGHGQAYPVYSQPTPQTKVASGEANEGQVPKLVPEDFTNDPPLWLLLTAQ